MSHITQEAAQTKIKACRVCGVKLVFPIDRPNTRGNWCNPCKSAYNVESARRNRATKRKNNNDSQKRNSERRAKDGVRYRENHPEKYAAHKAVRVAVRNGTLIKCPCEICGSTLRIHAHHDDYEKKLDVKWLCHTHHMERHQELNSEIGEEK